MSAPDRAENRALVLIDVIVADRATHSLAAAARLVGLHPEVLRHYCRLGFFGAARAQPGVEPVFDDDALYEVRRFEHFRRRHQLNRQTLRLLCGLWREVERLEAEVRFLRSR